MMKQFRESKVSGFVLALVAVCATSASYASDRQVTVDLDSQGCPARVTTPFDPACPVSGANSVCAVDGDQIIWDAGAYSIGFSHGNKDEVCDSSSHDKRCGVKTKKKSGVYGFVFKYDVIGTNCPDENRKALDPYIIVI
jgi:hypothetical protein